MKLRERVELFYKLAAEEGGLSQAEYDEWVKTKLPIALYDEIMGHIITYQDQPYFKLDVFLPAMYREFINLGWDPSVIWDAIGQIPKNGKKIGEDLLDRWAKDSHPDAFIPSTDFVDLFESYATPTTLRLAKIKIIKLITTLIKEDNIEGALNHLVKLGNSSTTFTPEFLRNLAKHFGLDIYLTYVDLVDKEKYYASDQSQESYFEKLMDESLQKKTLTIYDIALLFKYSPHTFYRDRFQQLLSKANPEAKDYIQGFIYGDGGYPLFILDNEYQPVDSEYKTVRWPPWIGPIKLTDLPSEERERWRQLFDDFKIVPH